MENIRRAVVPAIVIIIIVAALVYRLSSCAPGGANNAPAAAASASPSPSPDASPPDGPVSTPTPPYSDKEIEIIYDALGLSIVEIRNAGDVTMVHYYKPTGVAGEIISRFDWFNRRSGLRELVYGWAYTDKFEIKADKSFAVITTGVSHINGEQSFPKIFRASYGDIDGALSFNGAEDKYYAPLDQSHTIGAVRRESLTDINFSPGFVSLGFSAQPGYEAEFYAGYETTPLISIKNEAGYSTITLFNTTLSKDFREPDFKENTYCSLVSVTVHGTETVIRLKLNEKSVSRYNVSKERSPADGMPYAVIEFTGAAYDYPASW